MKVKLKKVEEKGNEKQKELMRAQERVDELKEKLKVRSGDEGRRMGKIYDDFVDNQTLEKEKETQRSKEEDEAHTREESVKLSYQQT